MQDSNYRNNQQPTTWAEKLRDRRWQQKKAMVRAAANNICEDCRNPFDNSLLEVHHTCYLPNRAPWEYGGEHLMSLCRPCHERRQRFEDAFRCELGKITRCLPIDRLEDEVWRIIKDVATRETERLAEGFQ